VVLDEIAEVAVFAFAYRPIEADGMPADLEYAPGFFNTDPGSPGGLFNAGLASHLLEQLLGNVAKLAHRLDHFDGDGDGSRLVGDGPGNRLPDPPRGIGAELVTAAIFVFVDGPHQARIALLDQIQEAQAPIAVFLGDADHQAQISAGQITFGLLVLRES